MPRKAEQKKAAAAAAAFSPMNALMGLEQQELLTLSTIFF